MNQPVTELDQRFSDPDAVAADWDDTRRVLEAAELSWICTVRPDGHPHLTRAGGGVVRRRALLLHWSGRAEIRQPAGRPARDPDDGCNRWEEGLDVAAEGEAVPGDRQRLPAKLAPSLGREVGRPMAIPGTRRPLRASPRAERPTCFMVRPTKVLAFAEGRFGQRRPSPARFRLARYCCAVAGPSR
jgi:hypothetical protein